MWLQFEEINILTPIDEDCLPILRVARAITAEAENGLEALRRRIEGGRR